MDTYAVAADELAVTPLLNCLVREATDPAGEPRAGRATRRLRYTGRLLRVRAGHRPSEPELWAGGAWRPLRHAALVDLVAEEMRAATGRPNDPLTAQMAASRTVVEALLAARDRATPPDDPWLRSEQALVMGHPFHPSPKARGGGPPADWLRYAPEAYARFPLALLGVREDAAIDEGDASALDALGEAPPGYRLLPVHPWQLELTSRIPEVRAAFADGRLVRVGVTPWEAVATASVRTVHVPARDLFLKFSLDVRITNDVRRLWRGELRQARHNDPLVAAAFRETDGPVAWLTERGHRTVRGLDETFPVLVRDGLGAHLLPGTTAVLAAALAEGFDGSPLDRVTEPSTWWSAYLSCVVPPLLEAYARHGVVVECHLQNTLIAVDAAGTPVQAVFRDAEGSRVIPQMSRADAWRRLVYCLLVNNLAEVAGALADRFPEAAGALWPAARREFERFAAVRDDIPEVTELLSAPTVPGKANLLSSWLDAGATEPRYVPFPNPLATLPEPADTGR
ncbi:IucA/IucC family protein [Streptomyces millisiae]|uniref:IucA/IucC family protein n=1 Tax=Streptomyces millisiae TaxID=3075542 RepID=A0ABU2LPY7_9ACTN|nr:IucA/IucC family protein [Streptomyces sp. DSM 44918]MDT0319649.1 IucA/IucC family protein [Streptomyces sp. DSM 44918]